MDKDLEQNISICVPAKDEDFKIFKNFIEEKFNIAYFPEDYNVRGKWLNIRAKYEKPYLANNIFKYLISSTYSVNYFGYYNSTIITLEEIKNSPINLKTDVLEDFLESDYPIFIEYPVEEESAYYILLKLLKAKESELRMLTNDEILDKLNSWIDNLIKDLHKQ